MSGAIAVVLGAIFSCFASVLPLVYEARPKEGAVKFGLSWFGIAAVGCLLLAMGCAAWAGLEAYNSSYNLDTNVDEIVVVVNGTEMTVEQLKGDFVDLKSKVDNVDVNVLNASVTIDGVEKTAKQVEEEIRALRNADKENKEKIADLQTEVAMLTMQADKVQLETDKVIEDREKIIAKFEGVETQRKALEGKIKDAKGKLDELLDAAKDFNLGRVKDRAKDLEALLKI